MEVEILEFSFEMNTREGIGFNLPIKWWDLEINEYHVIERTGFVTIHVKGEKKIVLQWIWNLARDGRYKLFPTSWADLNIKAREYRIPDSELPTLGL